MSGFEEYYKNSEWFGTYQSELMMKEAFEAGQQSQQAKVEELQTQLSLQRQRVKAFEEELTSSRNYGDELQKRVDAALAVLTEYYTGSYDESPDLVVDIEQALKGGGTPKKIPDIYGRCDFKPEPLKTSEDEE